MHGTIDRKFMWIISHSKKNSARHCQKCTKVFVKSFRCSCQARIKLEFSRQISLKISRYQISWISAHPVWAQLFQADRQRLAETWRIRCGQPYLWPWLISYEIVFSVPQGFAWCPSMASTYSFRNTETPNIYIIFEGLPFGKQRDHLRRTVWSELPADS